MASNNQAYVIDAVRTASTMYASGISDSFFGDST